MQLNECQRGSKKSDDVVKLQVLVVFIVLISSSKNLHIYLQTENDNYKRRVEELEQQVKQLNVSYGKKTQ
jgi:cell division protein FtsB